MLHVARGESERLVVLLFVEPDLEAGRLVTIVFRLPEMPRISICRIAMSKDFFDSDLPKPELPMDKEGFPEELSWDS